MTNQQGSIGSVFLIGCWTIALFCLIIAADVGRMVIYREQMRTAADAAALAGAMQVDRMVRVTLHREYWVSQSCTVEGEVKDCSYWATESRPFQKSGLEWQLWDEWASKFLEYCANGYRCLGDPQWECWVSPKSSWDAVETAARGAFEANARNSLWGQYLKSPGEVSVTRGSTLMWYEFHVDASAKAAFPAVFWRDDAGVSHQMKVETGTSRAVLLRRDKSIDQDPPCVRKQTP